MNILLDPYFMLKSYWWGGWWWWWVVAYRILVPAPVPFWVLFGLKLGWTGLGLGGLGTKGFGVGD